MSNFEFYFDADGQAKPEQLAKNRWLAYLTQTDNVYVNAERLERMRDVSGRETVEYVMRTLDVLDEALPELEPGSFDLKQIRAILTRTLQELENSGGNTGSGRVEGSGQVNVYHLNFKPLADSLYYDYEGRRHINVYKKRIIEKFLRDGDAPYVKFRVWVENGTAYVDFSFAAVCEKLIEFCVEAERSGLLTFEKSIIVLYDMFGFRKDEFDRLNNEDKYLRTMNDVSASTKDGIIDYVVGKSVVDVGSGMRFFPIRRMSTGGLIWTA